MLLFSAQVPLKKKKKKKTFKTKEIKKAPKKGGGALLFFLGKGPQKKKKKKNSIHSIAIQLVDETTSKADESTQVQYEEPGIEKQHYLPEAVDLTEPSLSSSGSDIIESLESAEVKKSKKSAKHHDTSLGKK